MPDPPLGLCLTRTAADVRRAAVLGRPIGHSLSPVLHRAAYAALGLTSWTYDALDCGADDLAGLVDRSGPEWVGFSVTMPGKRAALVYAAGVDAAAEAVGAANTLVRGAAGWIAANTDVYGIERSLGLRAGSGRPPSVVGSSVVGAPAVVIGAGGTAQAALVAFHRSGVGVVHALVRDPARTEPLGATAERTGTDLHVHRLDSATADDLFAAGSIVVCTLPGGAADPLAERTWSAGTVLLDVVYGRGPTPIAQAVAAAGGTAIDGIEMLLHQAGEQVRRMTGHDAPLAAMRAALP